MVGNIKAPVLSLEQDVLKDVNGGDAVQGLWACQFLFLWNKFVF
jgi:hypothetical protein